MFYVLDFIAWALTKVNKSTIPTGARLPIPIDACGTEPWQYLFGSVRVRTTDATLEQYYVNHYGNPNRYKPPMSREQYNDITASWDRNGYATDCQGLCDAWFTYEADVKTDINADMNYRLWCTDKGAISQIDRPFVVGEALFHANSAGKMTHVGWVCGFDKNGNALAVEARGISYGVVVTKVANRNWTHRGLMTTVFDYSDKPIEEDKPMEKIKFEKTTPMQKGEAFLAMQKALNLAGYTDDSGATLDEDGKWGTKSQQAFEALLANHAKSNDDSEPIGHDPINPEPIPIIITEKPLAVFAATNGEYEFRLFKQDATK